MRGTKDRKGRNLEVLPVHERGCEQGLGGSQRAQEGLQGRDSSRSLWLDKEALGRISVRGMHAPFGLGLLSEVKLEYEHKRREEPHTHTATRTQDRHTRGAYTYIASLEGAHWGFKVLQDAHDASLVFLQEGGAANLVFVFALIVREEVVCARAVREISRACVRVAGFAFTNLEDLDDDPFAALLVVFQSTLYNVLVWSLATRGGCGGWLGGSKVRHARFTQGGHHQPYETDLRSRLVVEVQAPAHSFLGCWRRVRGCGGWGRGLWSDLSARSPTDRQRVLSAVCVNFRCAYGWTWSLCHVPTDGAGSAPAPVSRTCFLRGGTLVPRGSVDGSCAGAPCFFFSREGAQGKALGRHGLFRCCDVVLWS